MKNGIYYPRNLEVAIQRTIFSDQYSTCQGATRILPYSINWVYCKGFSGVFRA